MPDSLSLREKQVFELIGRGFRDREIGEELGLHVGTIKRYIVGIYRKCGITRHEIIRFCAARDAACGGSAVLADASFPSAVGR